MAKQKEPMNLRQWWDFVGDENAQRVIRKLGTSLRYFRHLKYGNKKPSLEYAQRIVSAAQSITPGFEPDIDLLVAGVPKADRVPGTPAPEFEAAMKRRKQRRVS